MDSPLLLPALEQAVAAGPDSLVGGYAKQLEKLRSGDQRDN
jgi:hypothetical protein